MKWTLLTIGFFIAMFAISITYNSSGLFVGSVIGVMFGGLVAHNERQTSR